MKFVSSLFCCDKHCPWTMNRPHEIYIHSLIFLGCMKSIRHMQVRHAIVILKPEGIKEWQRKKLRKVIQYLISRVNYITCGHRIYWIKAYLNYLIIFLNSYQHINGFLVSPFIETARQFLQLKATQHCSSSIRNLG